MKIASIFTAATILGCFAGCSTIQESRVQVRDPKIGHYHDETVNITNIAREQWEYAAMSANAYVEYNNPKTSSAKKNIPSFSEESFRSRCSPNGSGLFPLQGWIRWEDFPKNKDKRKLYVEVMEREYRNPTIAVVFEGTEAKEFWDWVSDLDWITRYIPLVKDQYTTATTQIADEFLERIQQSPKYNIDKTTGDIYNKSGQKVKIITVGHSLGGGLAHAFAYHFPQRNKSAPNGPKVSQVYAFNTSPVTRWGTATEPSRSYNAEGLLVTRVYEHGEILSFVRKVTSDFFISEQNPTMTYYRYNFMSDNSPIENHGIEPMACSLINIAKPWL